MKSQHFLPYFCAILLFFAQTLTAAELKGEYVQPTNYFPKVKMETTMGDIVIELNRLRAKLTVDNFLTYVVNKDYDNTVFHRVEQDFVIQGGGFSPSYDELKARAPIPNESGNGLKNSSGTIAMAREHDAHSATRQFFFNINDNDSLNPVRRWGYAVFGEVTEGEEVLNKIANVAVDFHEKTGWPTVPVDPIIIKKVTVLPEEVIEPIDDSNVTK